MGHYALRDLKMAGVIWELADVPMNNNAKKIPAQQTFQTNRSQSKPVIIPPSAPIT